MSLFVLFIHGNSNSISISNISFFSPKSNFEFNRSFFSICLILIKHHDTMIQSLFSYIFEKQQIKKECNINKVGVGSYGK